MYEELAAEWDPGNGSRVQGLCGSESLDVDLHRNWKGLWLQEQVDLFEDYSHVFLTWIISMGLLLLVIRRNLCI